MLDAHSRRGCQRLVSIESCAETRTGSVITASGSLTTRRVAAICLQKASFRDPVVHGSWGGRLRSTGGQLSTYALEPRCLQERLCRHSHRRVQLGTAGQRAHIMTQQRDADT